MRNSSILTVKELSEPVRRAENKQARIEIGKLASDDKQSAPVRLRAFLSLGKLPGCQLATEQNITAALTLDDRVNFLPKLSENSKLVNAEAPLLAILGAMKDVGSRRALRITKSLYRTTAKWQKQPGNVTLGQKSLHILIQILDHLTRYQRTDASKRSSNRNPKNSPYLKLINTAMIWVVPSRDPESLSLLIKLIGSTEQIIGTSISDLADDEFSRHLQELVWRAFERCEQLIRQGADSEFQELAEVLLKLTVARDMVRPRLVAVYSDRARLSDSYMTTAMKITGHRTLDIFLRYNIVSTDDVHEAMDKVTSKKAVAK